MRQSPIPVLLFATYACAAQPHLSADQLLSPLLQGSLFRIADGQRLPAPTVTICLVTDPDPTTMEAAQKLVDRMFAGIRVRLKWYERGICRAATADPILLTIQTRVPKSLFPGALGAALPLEGTHAWVFYDRVLQTVPIERPLSPLLGHVMAHEIAHILQGIVRHSDSGIMKAQWSDFDCARMALIPLMFTREDAVLIHHGLEVRHSRMAGNASAGTPTAHPGGILAGPERSLTVP